MSDTISRQAVIELIKNSYYNLAENMDDVWAMVHDVEELPSAEPKTGDENELKFYYVESIDDYWIGRRLDNFYYADWHDGLGFVWSKSRYLPWGEHIVDENTMWKEHTYPSEPIEIPFTEWIFGFVKKYFADSRQRGEWIFEPKDAIELMFTLPKCSECGFESSDGGNFCSNCGARMFDKDTDVPDKNVGKMDEVEE